MSKCGDEVKFNWCGSVVKFIQCGKLEKINLVTVYMIVYGTRFLYGYNILS